VWRHVLTVIFFHKKATDINSQHNVVGTKTNQPTQPQKQSSQTKPTPHNQPPLKNKPPKQKRAIKGKVQTA
jgi:hypothetical protein